MKDHAHMRIEILPKYSIDSIVGFIKGKTTIEIAQKYRGKERDFTGEHFWPRGLVIATDKHTSYPSLVRSTAPEAKVEQFRRKWHVFRPILIYTSPSTADMFFKMKD